MALVVGRGSGAGASYSAGLAITIYGGGLFIWTTRQKIEIFNWYFPIRVLNLDLNYFRIGEIKAPCVRRYVTVDRSDLSCIDHVTCTVLQNSSSGERERFAFRQLGPGRRSPL